MARTLLVGLDAACWAYLDPLLAQGRLPNLKQLMASGAWGTLHSTLPAMTPTAWASIATGKNPGKHGVFDMIWRRPGSYDFLPVSSRTRVGTPFWTRLNQAGIRVGLVNVPFVYPPDPVDGFVVCGFGAPTGAADLTYPRPLLEEIEGRFGPFEPTVSLSPADDVPVEALLAAEREHQARMVEIAIHLGKAYQVDVLAVNLMLPDHANHYAPEMAQVETAICQTDAHLGRLLDGYQPDTILVISDHGSRRVQGNFLLYAWLRDRGFCVQRERPREEQSTALSWVIAQWLATHEGRSMTSQKVVRRVAREVIPRLPAPIATRVWLRLAEVLPFAREHVLLTEEPDPERSQVLPGSSYSGLLYLNVAGRDASGIVEPRSAAELAQEIATGLQSVIDPTTGRPLCAAIHPASALYAGPLAAAGPDLVLDSYESAYGVLTADYRDYSAAEIVRSDSSAARYFIRNRGRRDAGRHSREGIFVFSGSHIRSGPAPSPGHVIDIPATLLYLHNVPIPEDYDGRVMAATLDPSSVAHHPERYQAGDGQTGTQGETAFGADEAEHLLRRLRGLGYLV